MANKQHLIFSAFILSLLAFSTGCEHKMEQRKKDAAASGTPISPLVRIADSMNDSQDYLTAVKLYRQALDMDPKDIDAQMGLARSLAALGHYKKAIDTLEKILVKREHPGILQELGKLYLVSNKPKECIDAYSRVIHKDGQNVAAMNGMGVCHDIEGNHKTAQQWYQKALALAPENSGVKSNVGLSLVLEGNYGEGVPILSRLADRPEATQRDRQNLATALGLSGDIEQAAQLFSIDLRKEDVRRNLAMFHVYQKAEKAPKTLALKEISAPSVIVTENAEASPKVAQAETVKASKAMALSEITEDTVPSAVVAETAEAGAAPEIAQVTEVY